MNETHHTTGIERCSVAHADPEHLAVRLADGTTLPLRLRPAQQYLAAIARPGATLHLIEPRRTATLIEAATIVLDPDWLIDVSNVAACFKEYGAHALHYIYRLLEPTTPSAYNLLGNTVNQFFDDRLQTSKTYAESLAEAFRHDALAFLCTDHLTSIYFPAIGPQYAHIGSVIADQFGRQQPPLRPERGWTEPSLICPELGLQGRMDYLQIDEEEKPSDRQNDAGTSPQSTGREPEAAPGVGKETECGHDDKYVKAERAYLNHDMIFKKDEEADRKHENNFDGENESNINQNTWVGEEENGKRQGEDRFGNEEKGKRGNEDIFWEKERRERGNEDILENEKKEKRGNENILGKEEKGKRGNEDIFEKEERRERGNEDILGNEKKGKRGNENILGKEEKGKRGNEDIFENEGRRESENDDIFENEERRKSTPKVQGRRSASIIELKSGKWNELNHCHKTAHYVQTVLYAALLHYNQDIDYDRLHPYLLYSRYPLLVAEPVAHATLTEAIDLRNRIVGYLHDIAEGHAAQLFTQQAVESISTSEAKLWQAYERPRLLAIADTIAKASEVERTWFDEQLRFILTEETLARTGGSLLSHTDHGTASLWLDPFGRKAADGEIIYPLTLADTTLTPAGIVGLTFTIGSAPTGIGSPNFRRGDDVLLYAAESTEVNAARRIILRGNVETIDPTTLRVELRQPLRPSMDDDLRATAYACEHDAINSATALQCRAVYLMLLAPPRWRSLLLSGSQPREAGEACNYITNTCNAARDALKCEIEASDNSNVSTTNGNRAAIASETLNNRTSDGATDHDAHTTEASVSTASHDALRSTTAGGINAHDTHTIEASGSTVSHDALRSTIAGGINAHDTHTIEALTNISTLDASHTGDLTNFSTYGTPPISAAAEAAAREAYTQQLMEHILHTEDYFLLVGPPGTGKTSMMLRGLVERLCRDEGETVLLLSFTHRAVDEICRALSTIDGLDYLRFGRALHCHPDFHPHLIATRTAECGTRAALGAVVADCRVWVGTTASVSSNRAIFALKRFDTIIVDEASQLLEFQIVELLTHARRFILIGDHKQLPAVSLQPDGRSLFERLYRQARRASPGVVGTLIYQGRMHPDIAQFANSMFYGGILRPIPLPHQSEGNLYDTDAGSDDRSDATTAQQDHHEPRQNTPATTKSGSINRSTLPTASGQPHDPIAQLALRRYGFIDVAPPAERGRKYNTAEAQTVARIVSAIATLYAERHIALTDAAIGIIVPYRSQIAAIGAALAEADVSDVGQINIDTVERYQGSQRDVIIYCATVSTELQLSQLSVCCDIDGVPTDRKLNVIITRARKQFFMVGNRRLLTTCDVYRRLIEALEKKRQVQY